MKHFIGEIEETFGEYETNSHFVFSAPAGVDPDAEMDRLAKTFRGDEADADGVDGDYMVDGIRILARSCAEIPEDHFHILKIYMSDLTLSEES